MAQSYVVSVEVVPLAGAKLFGYAGAAVYCVVYATSAARARGLTRAALKEDHYRVRKIEFARAASRLEWDSRRLRSQFKRLTKQSQIVKDVVYSSFYAWRKR